jgi:hypothetical protein
VNRDSDRRYAEIKNAAIVGGLLYIAREFPQDIPLIVHCCSGFLGKALVTNRIDTENNPLGPNYDLIISVVSTLQERSGRTRFKKAEANPATGLSTCSNGLCATCRNSPRQIEQEKELHQKYF